MKKLLVFANVGSIDEREPTDSDTAGSNSESNFGNIIRENYEFNRPHFAEPAVDIPISQQTGGDVVTSASIDSARTSCGTSDLKLGSTTSELGYFTSATVRGSSATRGTVVPRQGPRRASPRWLVASAAGAPMPMHPVELSLERQKCRRRWRGGKKRRARVTLRRVHRDWSSRRRQPPRRRRWSWTQSARSARAGSRRRRGRRRPQHQRSRRVRLCRGRPRVCVRLSSSTERRRLRKVRRDALLVEPGSEAMN